MSKDNELDDFAEDDLTPYADLVGALRAPGFDSELVDEPEFLAAYREVHAPSATVVSLPRRLARRLGAGGTALVVVAAVGTSGVAAALTGNLPDPVQGFAHSVIGAPAPQPADPLPTPMPEIPIAVAETQATPTAPESAASAAPTPSPSAGAAESPEQEPTSPAPSAAAQPSSSPAPLDQPSKTPTTSPVVAPLAASVSIGAVSHLVGYAESVTLAGVVTTSDGSPVAGRRVVLQVRTAEGWRRVARLRSDPAGVVTSQTAPITELSRYRWRTRPGIKSSVWRLRVRATLSASYVTEGGVTTVNVASVGGRAGDVVSFYVRVKKTLTLLGEAPLSADGRTSLRMATPKRSRVVLVRLARSPDHTPARTKLAVIAPLE